jgi:hypothetical protein
MHLITMARTVFSISGCPPCPRASHRFSPMPEPRAADSIPEGAPVAPVDEPTHSHV